MIFQAFLVLLFSISLLLSTRLFSTKQFYKFLGALLVSAIGLISSIYPEFATWVANRLGIGRGADLLLYLTICTLFMGALIVFSKLKKLEDANTKLARELAIRTATDDRLSK